MKITILTSIFFLGSVALYAQETAPVDVHDTLRFHKYLDGHNAAVESLTYSRDGAYFATGSWDRKARLYSLDSLKNYSFLR